MGFTESLGKTPVLTKQQECALTTVIRRGILLEKKRSILEDNLGRAPKTAELEAGQSSWVDLSRQLPSNVPGKSCRSYGAESAAAAAIVLMLICFIHLEASEVSISCVHLEASEISISYVL